MPSPIVFRSPVRTNNPALPILRRDPLLVGDNTGVRHIFDLGFSWSYPGGSPTNGQVVKDVAERADASWVVSGAALAYAGGGIDFSQASAINQYVRIPPAALADLFTDQQYLVCAYFRMPSSADWTTNTSNALGMLSATDGAALNAGEFVNFTQTFYGSTQGINIGRGTSLSGTLDDYRFSPTAAEFGQVCQLAIWRNGSELGRRVKSATNLQINRAAPGSANTFDFSGRALKVGIAPMGAWSATIGTGAKNFRLYRAFVENLKVSGRDPVTVLDADWARVAARGIFS